MDVCFKWEANSCRGCLATERKMIDARYHEVGYKYLTGLVISLSDGLPQQFCYECSALLKKFNRFRDKMMESHYLLCQFVQGNVQFERNMRVHPHLSRTGVVHHKIPDTEQVCDLEEQVSSIIVYDTHMTLSTETESGESKEDLPEYEDKIEIEEWCPEKHRNELPSNSSILESNCKQPTEQKEVLHQESHTVDEGQSLRARLVFDEDIHMPEKDGCAAKRRQSRDQSANYEMHAYCDVIDSATFTDSGDNDDNVKENAESDENSKSDDNIDNDGDANNVKSLVCDQCNKDFINRTLLLTHKRFMHVADKRYRCDVCFRQFTHKHNLDNHSRIHTDAISYQCDTCSKRFVNKYKLIDHLNVHLDKQYICDVCAKSFKQKYYLIKHLAVHASKKPFQCEICTKSFSIKSRLFQHSRIHTGDKPYKCNVCYKGFIRKPQLKRHIRIHTDDIEYVCDICLHCFTTQSNLKEHILSHTDNSMKCNKRMKCFKTKSILKNHTCIQTGYKPYKCEVCMKCFTNKSKLNNHAVIHTGEKPYKCGVCMKCFAKKSYLKNHMRTHTGDKPYKCDVCAKSFSHKNNLTTHARQHTGDKPYKCDVCMKRFTNGSNLLKHTRRIHENNKQK